MFNDAKIYNFDEVAKNRSLRDFLLIVKSIDSKFNSIHTINLLETIHVSTTMKQMHDLIEKFRHTICQSDSDIILLRLGLSASKAQNS